MSNDQRHAWVIPEIYDGISIWVEPDGTFTNRWSKEDGRRYEKAQYLVDYLNTGVKLSDEMRAKNGATHD